MLRKSTHTNCAALYNFIFSRNEIKVSERQQNKKKNWKFILFKRKIILTLYILLYIRNTGKKISKRNILKYLLNLKVTL
jgi:hypothetical protein